MHNGCEALLSIREYEWIPTLVTAIEEPNNPYKVMVAETLVCLCDLLREEISGPREQARFREPARIAQQVLPSLEGAVDRYEQHRCREVLEAFLMLASHENSVLKRILCEPRHPAYLVVSEVLGSSSRISVIRLILNLLELRLRPAWLFKSYRIAETCRSSSSCSSELRTLRPISCRRICDVSNRFAGYRATHRCWPY